MREFLSTLNGPVRTSALALTYLATVFCILVQFHRPSLAQSDSADFRPDQSKLPAVAPPNAIMLWDGKSLDSWRAMDGSEVNWLVENGELVSTARGERVNHIVSKLHFRDADIHVEFMTASKGHGNSGIYIHGNYELQIYDSFGKEKPDQNDEGAIYGFHPPLVNAALQVGQWQVYDIRYTAPRRDSSGKIIEAGHITAWLNGKLVQSDSQFTDPRSTYHPFRYGTTDYLKTINQKMQQTSVGPFFLQDHQSPVRFRNVWVVPRDDQHFVYEPTQK
jgi:hypothetical protein